MNNKHFGIYKFAKRVGAAQQTFPQSTALLSRNDQVNEALITQVWANIYSTLRLFGKRLLLFYLHALYSNTRTFREGLFLFYSVYLFYP